MHVVEIDCNQIDQPEVVNNRTAKYMGKYKGIIVYQLVDFQCKEWSSSITRLVVAGRLTGSYEVCSESHGTVQAGTFIVQNLEFDLYYNLSTLWSDWWPPVATGMARIATVPGGRRLLPTARTPAVPW